MEIQITKNISLDGFIIIVIGLIALATIGTYLLILYASEQQELGLADVDGMGCGELKDFILNKGWNEYGARMSVIQSHAEHQYTWMCEK